MEALIKIAYTTPELEVSIEEATARKRLGELNQSYRRKISLQNHGYKMCLELNCSRVQKSVLSAT